VHFSARLATELKLVALREKNRWRAQAATKIQKLARCRQAKKRVETLRRERLVEFVTLARQWVEFWNEDSAKWFYYNQEVRFRHASSHPLELMDRMLCRLARRCGLHQPLGIPR
jgi:hypothetical protein